jgi:hypothetical protein
LDCVASGCDTQFKPGAEMPGVPPREPTNRGLLGSESGVWWIDSKESIAPRLWSNGCGQQARGGNARPATATSPARRTTSAVVSPSGRVVGQYRPSRSAPRPRGAIDAKPWRPHTAGRTRRCGDCAPVPGPLGTPRRAWSPAPQPAVVEKLGGHTWCSTADHPSRPRRESNKAPAFHSPDTSSAGRWLGTPRTGFPAPARERFGASPSAVAML